ncbi:MAG TPA: Ig-like domain-containing protein [Pantanalinema sp.]
MATPRNLLPGALLCTLSLLAGCDMLGPRAPGDTQSAPLALEALALSPQSLTLSLPGEGEGQDLFAARQRLAVVLTPQDATASLAWASSHPEIASVDGTGLVTAAGTGTTEVSVRIDAERFATASVTVLDRGQANVTLH